MKTIVAAALLALSVATVGAVNANAASFSEDFFKNLQLNGNLVPDKLFEDLRLNGN